MRMENPNEKDEQVIKKILDETKDVQVPESLHPEAVEKMLEEKYKGQQEQSTVNQTAKRRRVLYGAALAACLCVAVGIAAVQSGFFDGGLIQNDIAVKSQQSSAGENAKKASTGKTTQIASAKDYDEIYDYLQEEKKEQENYLSSSEEKSAVDSAASSAAADSSAYAGSASSEAASDSGAYAGSASDSSAAASAYSAQAEAAGESGFTDTNVREEGVGEGDIVKTDGENLYILNRQKIQIVGISGAEMEALSTIRLEEEKRISELYIEGDTLMVAYTSFEYADEESAYWNSDRQYTGIDLYDVSTPGEPSLIDSFTQSGSFYTMRVSGGYVYLLSQFYASLDVARSEIDAYIPQVKGDSLDSTKILLPPYSRGRQYTVISSFPVSDASGQSDSVAVFGNAGLCYVSSQNIYVCEAEYGAAETEVSQTCIRKIGYKDGVLNAVGQTKIDGTLKDSFCIDEYEGYLRLVTTVSYTGDGIAPLGVVSDTKEETLADTNSLYVLDENLEITGSIHDLAEDEQVYSARFMGDTGYFVTFRQTDPLFSVDLSDPAKPEIIGKLKIPGFSEYLHPFGEGNLIGIGMDVDETGTVTNGVKLSVYDISDASDVKETEKYVLEGMYGTDVAYDYKSVMASPGRGIIGFSAYGQSECYYIFRYSEGIGFELLLTRELAGYGLVRGICVGERFYLVSGNTVECYTLDTFEKTDDIVL